MASLEFDEVSKTYGSDVWAVRELTLAVNNGEFVVLVGPSGCGKTTALRMLAGLEPISAGEIRIGGVRVNDTPSRDRDIAMVFQNYALYPHLSVYDNIGYGLKVRRVPKAERRARVEEAAGMLGLTDELKRRPSQLSGGQRQRVAMGRAIVRRPEAFLMDEPLSNLDARLRVQMRTEIARIQRELGVTTIYVTHDQVEAMTMADRVAVLRRGELQQFETPQRVYSNPANLFVGVFIGSPAMNVVEGRLSQGESGIECHVGDYHIAIPDQIIADGACPCSVGRSDRRCRDSTGGDLGHPRRPGRAPWSGCRLRGTRFRGDLSRRGVRDVGQGRGDSRRPSGGHAGRSCSGRRRRSERQSCHRCAPSARGRLQTWNVGFTRIRSEEAAFLRPRRRTHVARQELTRRLAINEAHVAHLLPVLHPETVERCRRRRHDLGGGARPGDLLDRCGRLAPDLDVVTVQQRDRPVASADEPAGPKASMATRTAGSRSAALHSAEGATVFRPEIFA